MPPKMKFTLETQRLDLIVDERGVLNAMADEAIAILQEGERLPSRSGEFAESVRAELAADGSISVGPTGERNEIIARVFAARGIDLFEFSQAEIARIIAAAQAEVDRQIREGAMRVEGSS